MIFGKSSLNKINKNILKYFDVRPPIKRNDLNEFFYEKNYTNCILICDGLFGQELSVTIEECYKVLENPNNVLMGSSCIGALRAVDCYQQGMMGIGNVFMGYHLGFYQSDSYVANLYNDEFQEEFIYSYVHIDYIVQYLIKKNNFTFLHYKKIMQEIDFIYWEKRTIEVVFSILKKYFLKLESDAVKKIFTDKDLNPKLLDAEMAVDYIFKYYLKGVL